MLHTETVLPGTLDLLRELQALAPLADMRLVGGTALALLGLTYFDDAEDDPMPRMFTRLTWPEAKTRLLDAVRRFSRFI